MADCRPVSYITVAQTDRSIGGGITIPRNTAYFPSAGLVGEGAGGGTAEIQFGWVSEEINTDQQVRVIPAKFDIKLSGTEGTTGAGQNIFQDLTANFVASEIVSGDILRILEGPDQGFYDITSVSPTVLVLAQDMTSDGIQLDYEIIAMGAGVIPDYSSPITARIMPGVFDAHRSYRPFFGPGDHFGNDGLSNEETGGDDINTFIAGHANFSAEGREVQAGIHYLQIAGGPNAGLYLITSVVNDTTVKVSPDFPEVAADQDWRISIIGDGYQWVPPVTIVESLGTSWAIPSIYQIPIKIAWSVFSQIQSIQFDNFREDPDDQAETLWNRNGNYLACYRIKYDGSLETNRIIVVKPWYGFEEVGPLFTDGPPNPSQKFQADDPDDPQFYAQFLWPKSEWRITWAMGMVVGFRPEPFC